MDSKLSLTDLIFSTLILFFGVIVAYWATPTLDWGFGGLFFYLFLFSMVCFMLKPWIGISAFFSICLLLIIALFSSCEMGRSDVYRDLIGKKNDGVFTQEVSPIDEAQIRSVDQESAQQIGDKLIGADSALGSRAYLATMTIQNVNGKIWWVAPILHSGFFAWNNHTDGTPGYIKVSATNPNDYQFVRNINGKDLKIKYQPGAYFNTEIERHIWLNGYITKGKTDYTFEIDDNGKPYYVVTIYDKKIGFSGSDAIGIVTVDVESGEIRYYNIPSIPSWVDRVQPDNFVYDQLVWWGEYQNDWFNPGGEGKLKPTHRMLFVHGEDGRGYWYTTITSQGKDESISGFVMIDSKTKKFNYYPLSGATDTAATNSILGRVREKAYTASPAILYNISGRATYVVSLKDSAGVIKAIGLADVENHSITGIGSNIRDALRDYSSNQNSRANANLPDSHSLETTISGIVTRFATDIRNGNSYYYFRISEKADLEFVMDSTVSTSIITTNVGDEVVVSYNTVSETGIIQISKFENKSLPLGKKQKQTEVDGN